MTIDSENWRVYIPRVVVVPIRVVAYLTLLVGFALVDLVDPRNP